MNLSPEYLIVSGDKSTLTMRPVFGEYYIQPSWKNINGDGLVDLMVLVQRDNKAFIYIQNDSGLPLAPTQSIELLEGTAWITLYDINEHHGKEMLISTSEGLTYFPQNNGVFEMKPEKLIEARQVFLDDTRPLVIELNNWPDDMKNAIPVVFSDHTIIYKCDENYRLNSGKKIEHEFNNTMEEFNWNSWSIGSKKSDQILIRTTAQEKSKDRREQDPTEDNEYIKKMFKQIKGKPQQDCFIEKRDINNDGNKDVILLHLQQDIDVKTYISIFKRREDGKLPKKPDQIIRCRGMPIIGDYPHPSHCNPFFDINNDGFSDIVFMEPEMIVSVNALFEIFTSEGMDWILTVRLYQSGKGFSDRADFKMDFKAMLPFSDNFSDLINIKGDFNGDGRKDLIIRRSTTQSDMYVSSLSNGFFEQQPRLRLEMPQKGKIFVKDLNSDGILDIFAIDHEKGRITLYLSDPI
jgi:hypothetical protein